MAAPTVANASATGVAFAAGTAAKGWGPMVTSPSVPATYATNGTGTILYNDLGTDCTVYIANAAASTTAICLGHTGPSGVNPSGLTASTPTAATTVMTMPATSGATATFIVEAGGYVGLIYASTAPTWVWYQLIGSLP